MEKSCTIFLVFVLGVSWTSSTVVKRDSIPGIDLSALEDTYKEVEKAKRIHNEDLTDDLATWKASSKENADFLNQNFPYYLAGYDKALRPLWCAEFGKMDLRTVVEKGDDLLKDFEQYVKQAAYRIHISMKNRSSEVNEVSFLLDSADLKMRQVGNIPVLKLIVKLAYAYRDLLNGYMGPSAIINANFLAEMVIRIVKPALGPAFAHISVLGTKKHKWEKVVQNLFGPENIPDFYGGTNKNFKPLAFYG